MFPQKLGRSYSFSLKNGDKDDVTNYWDISRVGNVAKMLTSILNQNDEMWLKQEFGIRDALFLYIEYYKPLVRNIFPRILLAINSF